MAEESECSILLMLIIIIIFFHYITNTKCVFGFNLKNQLILLFSLFLLLFMSFTILFGTFYNFHYTISANFYFYLQYF